jgi:hypothetical protein
MNVAKILNLLLSAALVTALTAGRLSAHEKQGEKTYPPTRNYTVTEAASPVKIDGILDEEAWQTALNMDLPFEWSPGDNITPPVKTECMVTYNRSNLYIAFRCFDPEPRKIRSHLMNRDAIDTFVQDDHIDIMIDCFNDERRAFQFRVNPLGVQTDAIFSGIEGYEDFSWDAIWDSVGKVTEFGYVVEIAIPFNQLRFPKNRDRQTWGFSAERSYPRSVRHRITSHPVPRDSSCLLCRFNKLSGFRKISPGRNIELDPTLTVNRTDERESFPAGSMEAGKVQSEPGITAKWGITPNLILNAAVNPDFSQVEADAAQLEVNTRYALRYPEKRPFFLEGGDFFNTPMEAVFTRTVYDPVWGIKASGKLGKSALGFFAAQDRYNNLLFPSNQGSFYTSVKQDVFGGVFRYRRDVGKGSTVGVLYTGRAAASDGDDYYNHVTGIDGFFRFSPTNTLNVQYLHSQTRYSEDVAEKNNQDQGVFGGDALSLQFTHMGRNLMYLFKYENLTPGFRADYGFISRVDTRTLTASIIPVIWGKPGGWFNQISFMFRGERITDHDNNLTNQDLEISVRYQGPMQSLFQQNYIRRKEYYAGVTYDINRFNTYLNMSPMGGLNFFVFACFGDAVDYYNARLARIAYVNTGAELGLGKHLNLNVNHTFQRLSLEGDKIHNVHLLQTRFVYNFNVRTFIRAIFQYTHIDRDTAMYTCPVNSLDKELFTQLLFSYKINPRTVLFVGYSDNRFGERGIDLTRNDRTFFLKLGYALVL